jgi:hypothetical protein
VGPKTAGAEEEGEMIEPKSLAEVLREHPVTKEEVEALIAKLRAAGAKVVDLRSDQIEALVNRINGNAKTGE